MAGDKKVQKKIRSLEIERKIQSNHQPLVVTMERMDQKKKKEGIGRKDKGNV